MPIMKLQVQFNKQATMNAGGRAAWRKSSAVMSHGTGPKRQEFHLSII